MVSVSHVAKKVVRGNLLMEDYLARGLINYAALAEILAPKISEEMGKKVKQSAIAMALRRHAENLECKHKKFPKVTDFELIMKSKLSVITVAKSPTLFHSLSRLNSLIDFEKGDILNIVHGNTDVSIIVNKKYKKELSKLFQQQKIINQEYGLVGLTVRFGIDYLHTPGVTYTFLRALAMEDINLIEVVSSTVETTFIIEEKDAVRAYSALNSINST